MVKNAGINVIPHFFPCINTLKNRLITKKTHTNKFNFKKIPYLCGKTWANVVLWYKTMSQFDFFYAEQFWKNKVLIQSLVLNCL